MAWPKKGTRKITVDGLPLLWHYAAHCVFCRADAITVGVEGERYFLYIDPFPWGFEFRPRSVADSVRWALAQGWSPALGPTCAMAWDDKRGENVWLPEGARHLADLPAGKLPNA